MLAFIDVETTGLMRPADGRLLEVAIVLTDDDLNEVFVAHKPIRPIGMSVDDLRAKLDPYVLKMHTDNGLLADIEEQGTRCYQMEEWLISMFEVVFHNTPCALAETPLAGSNVGFDRNWLREYMPKLEKRFHYHNLDVSSIWEAAVRWAPDVQRSLPTPVAAHRALPDIRDSIELLKYYRRNGLF